MILSFDLKINFIHAFLFLAQLFFYLLTANRAIIFHFTRASAYFHFPIALIFLKNYLSNVLEHLFLHQFRFFLDLLALV